MMYQGSSVAADGTVRQPYFPVEAGVLRTWDTEACLTFMGADAIDLTRLDAQLALAGSTRARPLFTLGFSGDPAFPPPAAVLLPGSNRPRPDYLDRAVDALLTTRLDFFEAWNEPAVGSLYWDGTPLEMYEQTARLAPRFRGRTLLSPSLNALDQPYGLDFARAYVRLMLDRGPACDGVAFHLYAGSMASVRAQLDALDGVTRGLGLPRYCTEFNGPWEAFDEMRRRGVELVVLNGQQPPGPYEDPRLAARWNEMAARLTTTTCP